MTSSMFDLIVVGGGPAGSAAAITAVRGGARVLLLERGRLPRHKVCGEFVSAESLELLGSLLHGQHLTVLNDAVRISRTRLYVDGRMIRAVVDPPAASIARCDLDAALWGSAQLAGVDARQQVTVQEIGDRGPFRICSSDGEFESRAVINASGRWSILNGTTAAAEQKWVGLKAHFAESSPEASVDLYFFDGGYCGVQPVARGRVNACAMVRADVASTLDEVFERHGALRKRSRGWELLTTPVSTSPLIFREPQPERDGILLAGDAAGFVDPFAGDGISLALRSGAMAAHRLMLFFSGEISLGQVVQEYRCAYERSLLPIFRTSSQLRRLLTLPRPARRPLLLVLEKSPRIAEYLVRRTRKAPLEPRLPDHQHFTHIVAGKEEFY